MSICLTTDELIALTGYHQPARQVAELRGQGFWRARHKDGRVILERAHYEAVCAGAQPERKITGRVVQFKAA